MTRPPFSIILFLTFSLLLSSGTSPAADTPEVEWKIHDTERPLPKIVTPPQAHSQAQTEKPPSDAIVLFDGKDLSKWVGKDGGEARWQVENGVMTSTPTGDIQTKQEFGDCQLHVEWRTLGEGHGNSGFYLMGLYELQVFESFHYKKKIYADGQAGAIYGQHPPLVNACRDTMQWQTFDVVFHRPHFNEDGKLLRPATMTVLHNGVLVQDHAVLTGPTAHKQRPPYSVHASKLPLLIQYHGDPLQFRNMWIRPLEQQ